MSILEAQSLPEEGIASFRSVVLDPHGQGLSGAHDNHQLPPSVDSCVDQVPLQQYIMLGQDWHDHRRIFGPLGFMDGNGIG